MKTFDIAFFTAITVLAALVVVGILGAMYINGMNSVECAKLNLEWDGLSCVKPKETKDEHNKS